MRHHYEKPKAFIEVGERYVCNHPVYDVCTLFREGNRGLAVIQQRFNRKNKSTYWSELDPWLAYDIYFHPRFLAYFDYHAGQRKGELYPTVTVRQLMWALRMKPLKKERWATVFDRKDI